MTPEGDRDTASLALKTEEAPQAKECQQLLEARGNKDNP